MKVLKDNLRSFCLANISYDGNIKETIKFQKTSLNFVYSSSQNGLRIKEISNTDHYSVEVWDIALQFQKLHLTRNWSALGINLLLRKLNGNFKTNSLLSDDRSIIYFAIWALRDSINSLVKKSNTINDEKLKSIYTNKAR